jgi:hypothetical protein
MKIRILSALCLAMMFAGCRDIIEKDLSPYSVSVISPKNNHSAMQSHITFWWNEVAYANEYRLEIVTPSFESVQRFVLDTTVTVTRFGYTLAPGKYQWRIRGRNGSSATQYSTYLLTILTDSTRNLSNSSVLLSQPSDNAVSSVRKQTFSWYSDNLPQAVDFRFDILGSGGNYVYSNANVKSDSISFTFTSDGTYTWQVRAQNEISVSPYSSRKITIDTSSPEKPVPQRETDTLTASSFPHSFRWRRPSLSGSALTDSIYISKDSLFKSFTVRAKALVSSQEINSYQVTSSPGPGRYFWRVRSIDAAGNKSPYSDMPETFIIK